MTQGPGWAAEGRVGGQWRRSQLRAPLQGLVLREGWPRGSLGRPSVPRRDMALARVVSSRLLMTGGCSPLKQQETGAGESWAGGAPSGRTTRPREHREGRRATRPRLMDFP